MDTGFNVSPASDDVIGRFCFRCSGTWAMGFEVGLLFCFGLQQVSYWLELKASCKSEADSDLGLFLLCDEYTFLKRRSDLLLVLLLPLFDFIITVCRVLVLVGTYDFLWYC